jgi:hypothetical protein
MEHKISFLTPNVVFLYLIELLFSSGVKKINKIVGFEPKSILIKVCPFSINFILHTKILITNNKKASGALACKVCISPGCGRKTRGLSPRIVKFDHDFGLVFCSCGCSERPWTVIAVHLMHSSLICS